MVIITLILIITITWFIHTRKLSMYHVLDGSIHIYYWWRNERKLLIIK